MDYILNKGLVKAWLRKLIKHGILVAPIRLEGGDIIFKEAFNPDNILLECKKTLYSAKPFFLPQEETLFTFRERSFGTIKEVFDEFPRIFFGLRPCDLKAIIQADRFFTENYQDPYYRKRREHTLLIVIGCNDPDANCFCHAMGLGPFYHEGADIFLADMGNSFIVTPITPNGINAVEKYRYFFEEATAEQQGEKSRHELTAMQKLVGNLPLTDVRACYSLIDDEFVSSISRKCAACGSCSYVCPMCFCYNVVDRENKDLEGKRVRTWDSCIFEGFTRMAGRHNLIKSRQERLKKRFAHKLKQYPETYGFPGCTGCGRCSLTCLGHISMLDVLKKVTAEVGK